MIAELPESYYSLIVAKYWNGCLKQFAEFFLFAECKKKKKKKIQLALNSKFPSILLFLGLVVVLPV